MPANFEKVHSFSRLAGADYSASPPSGGQYHFAALNPNAVTSYTNPDNPGLWYGSSANPPPIPAGNVLVNTTAGADCDFVLMGKALPGQPIECGYSGRLLVVCGGTIAVGQPIMSDNQGRAVAWTSGNHILGDAFEAGVAGDQISINFVRRGEA